VSGAASHPRGPQRPHLAVIRLAALGDWNGRSGGGILRPPARPPRLSWAPFREVLRVGGMSALVSATTNLTIAIITAYVGTAGVAALAGYGAGARLEFILVPLSYGIGGPAGILIGTNIGAGRAAARGERLGSPCC
jgi:Na+-driven multidrug efflux pump